MGMDYLLLPFLFCLGLSVGSFLNVVVYRVNNDDSVARGRSYCPKCKHVLAWYDLIPLLSFIILLGKCRYCKKNISWQYPLVELTTGILAVGIWNYALRITHYELLSIILFLSLFIIFASLLVIFVSDFIYQTVPMQAIIIGIIFSIIYVLFISPLLFLSGLITGVVSMIFFVLLRLITRGRGMGFGDCLIALFMGIFLGPQKTITALYISFLTGAFLGVILILIRKKRFGEKIAFGPFLVLGTFIAFFLGEILWKIILPENFRV